MPSDEPVFDLHDLDKIHLFAVRRLSRVLPHDPMAVSKIPFSESLSGRRRMLKNAREKISQLFTSLTNTLIHTQQMRYQGAFQGRVRCIQGQCSLKIFLPEGV